MTPQVKTLLTHLLNHGSISQAEAATVYRIRALPRRIADLKAMGHKITRELKQDPTGQRYARYSMHTVKVGQKVKAIRSDMFYTAGDTGVVEQVDATQQIANIKWDAPRQGSSSWWAAINDLETI
jgi:hypothetical protein